MICFLRRFGDAAAHFDTQMQNDGESLDRSIGLPRDDQREPPRLEVRRLTQQYRQAMIDCAGACLKKTKARHGEWAELAREFQEAHQLNDRHVRNASKGSVTSGLEGWIYADGTRQLQGGPGGLQFRQLSNRAVRAVGCVDQLELWKHWLEILAGYLLQWDPDQEYIKSWQAAPAAQTEEIKPSGRAGNSDITAIGENYAIRQPFKASADLCSWLRGNSHEVENQAESGPEACRDGKTPYDRLAEYKVSNKLRTHELVAEKLGLERSVYFALKAGRKVSQESYIKAARALGCSIDDLKG